VQDACRLNVGSVPRTGQSDGHNTGPVVKRSLKQGWNPPRTFPFDAEGGEERDGGILPLS
jgi:hypothetical protein